MSKTILVTGGAGFIGSNLCEAILRMGYSVRCLDNLSTGKKKHVEMFLDNNNYSYLIDNDDYSNMMFCKEEEDSVEEITDQDLIEKLVIKIKNNLDSEMY